MNERNTLKETTDPAHAAGDAPDMGRIKRNVAKMVAMNAPEADIDGYIESEGVTVDQVKAFKPQKSNSPRSKPETANAPPSGAPPSVSDTEGSYTGDPNAPGGPSYDPMWYNEGPDSKLPTAELSRLAQARFDEGASYEEIQQLATDNGHQPFDDKQLRAAFASRDAGRPVNFLAPSQKAQAPLALQSSPSEAEPEILDLMGEGAKRGVVDIASLLSSVPEHIPGIGEAIKGGRQVWNSYFPDEAAPVPIGAESTERLAADAGFIDPSIEAQSLSGKVALEGSRFASGSVVPLAGLGARGVSLARRGADAASALDKLALAVARNPGKALGSEVLGSAGAASGGEVGDALMPGDPNARALGNLIGGVAGGSIPLGRSAVRAIGDERFAKLQADNPHAALDAEIAKDASRIVDSAPTRDATRRKLPKGQREATIVRRVDELERSYLPFDDVAALDIAPSRKAQLRKAMEQRHTISDQQIESLRGTPEGDAVADAITKARRLRHYVPEGSADVESRGLLGWSADTAGAAIGSAVAGPKGAIASRILTRALRAQPSGRPVANAKAAKALAKLEERFDRMREPVGPSTASETGAALRASADEARDAVHTTRQSTMAERARAKLEQKRLEYEGQRVATRNARDNIKPSGGFRGYLYERTGLMPQEQDRGALSLLNSGKITPEQFDMFLTSPDKLQLGNAGNAMLDRLGAMADDGMLSELLPVSRTPR